MKAKGFSLMELVVAMGIFSIVIAMATGIFQYYLKTKRKIDIQQTLRSQIKLGLDLMCKDLRGMTLLVNTEFRPLITTNNDIDITNTGTANDDNDGDGYCNEDPVGDMDNPNTPEVDESGDGNFNDDGDGQTDEDDIDLDSDDSITFNDYDVMGRGQAEGLAAGVPYTSNIIDDDNDGQIPSNEDKVVDGTDNDGDGLDGEDPEHGIGIGYEIGYRILNGKLIKENLTLGTSKPLVENVAGLSIICRDGTEQTINTNADIGQVRSIEIIMAVSKDAITEVLSSKVYPRILQP